MTILLKEKEKAEVILYSDLDKFKSADVMNYLKKIGVQLKAYHEIMSDLLNINGKSVGLELDSMNAKIVHVVKSKGNTVIDLGEHLPILKLKKNPVELDGFRKCHIRDGAGLVKFLAWLEHKLNVEKKTDINEYAAAEKVREFRKEQEKFVDLSFETISSIGANGSVIHYSPEKDKSQIINNKEVYLLDSGVQYLYFSL